ncbi:TIGR03546 family protein [candidate division KSB1 bacterium]|nr:TIGR03546 family protein [candidate division KSB1 bacterium]
MAILKILANIIKVLQSEISPSQIAGGVVLGMILGLTPFWSLQNFIVILLVIVVAVNVSMMLLSFAFFSGVAYLLDPLFHSLGYYFLADVPSLKPLWTAVVNSPVLALSDLNNTVTLGSLLVSLFLVLPVFFLSKKFVLFYRRHLAEKVKKMKIIRIVTGSKIFNMYQKFKLLGD